MYKFIALFVLVFAPLVEAAATHNHKKWGKPDKDKDVLYGEWPIVGQDYGNQGNAETSIDSSNVGGLFGNLKFSPFTNPALFSGFISGQPSVADGVAYYGDSNGAVFAVDTATGDIIWKIQLDNEFITTPVITKKYIYISGGNLFNTALGVVKVFAIDRETGDVAWSKPLGDNSGLFDNIEDYTGDITAVGDLIIFGVANTENFLNLSIVDFKARGSIVALNRFTGEEVWRFYTTSDQLKENPRYGGGVGVWSSPGVDLKRGLVYFGTGQSFELPASPLEDSLLELKIKNGNLERLHRMSINDVWAPAQTPTGPDWDVNTHANLFSVKIQGEGEVDFVGVADKSGKYYIMRRGPKGLDRGFDAILFLDKGSTSGTIQSTPAIDDENDILYIASDAIVSDNGVRVTLDGADLICDSQVDPLCAQSYIVPKVSAFDLKALLNGSRQNDSLLWENSSSADLNNRGQSYGPLVLANDVLFHATGNGTVRVLNTVDGSVLTETQPLGPGAPIFAGVTIVGKQVFVSTAIGLFSYELP